MNQRFEFGHLRLEAGKGVPVARQQQGAGSRGMAMGMIDRILRRVIFEVPVQSSREKIAVGLVPMGS
jgi:hypothetical protein